MREALFILLVLLALLAITAYRYRRGIGAFLEFWRTLKAARERLGATERSMPAEKLREPTALVNCMKCGKWIGEDVAITLGRTGNYCSTRCLESSVKSA